jgi:transposase InsO family protein
VTIDSGSVSQEPLYSERHSAAGAFPKRTRSYTPRTNGKAERFSQPPVTEWTYAARWKHQQAT